MSDRFALPESDDEEDDDGDGTDEKQDKTVAAEEARQNKAKRKCLTIRAIPTTLSQKLTAAFNDIISTKFAPSPNSRIHDWYNYIIKNFTEKCRKIFHLRKKTRSKF